MSPQQGSNRLIQSLGSVSLVRNFVTLSVALVALAAFTGCIGVLGSHDDPAPESPAGVHPATTGGVTPPVSLTVLSALKTTITADGGKWVANGTSINVAASPLQGAVGDTQIAWFTGPMSATAPVPVKANANSGYIDPGNATGIKFNVDGVFWMHCHPHPWMRSNVTVVEGWQNAATMEVDIVDGASPSEFRFVPENITVHPGTTIIYRNVGQQVHTAMQLQQDAPLKPLDIKGLSGKATIQGVGWQRVVMLSKDSQGRYGAAEYDVYATSTLPAPGHWFFNLSTPHGAPDAAPGAAGGDFDSKSFKPDFNGTMFVNYTARSAPAATLNGAGQPVPDPATKVQIHVKEAGIEQDVLSGDSAGSGNITGHTHDTIHTVMAKADQGAGITTEVEVTVIYDLIPPPPGVYIDPESIPHQH